MNISSPYKWLDGREEILNETQSLIDQHPLQSDEIVNLSLKAWNIIQSIEVNIEGVKYRLSEINSEGSLYGGLIDKILSKLVAKNYSDWRMTKSKSDKDIVYKKNDFYSIEVKSGGQKICKVFGNRSYNDDSRDEFLVKKSIQGYYITLNYWEDTLYLIRFGWVDESDWVIQKTRSGQQSKIKPSAYQLKLPVVYGDYLLETPCQILKGINVQDDSDNTTKLEYKRLKSLFGILTYRGDDKKILKRKAKYLLTGIVSLSGGDTLIDLRYFLINKVNIRNIILEEIAYLPLDYIEEYKKARKYGDKVKNLVDILNYNGSDKYTQQLKQGLNNTKKLSLEKSVFNSLSKEIRSGFRDTILSESQDNKNLAEIDLNDIIKVCDFDIEYFKSYTGKDKGVENIKEFIYE